MTQSPYPLDQSSTSPDPADAGAESSQPAAGSPSSDPAQHPHDPYAARPDGAEAPAASSEPPIGDAGEQSRPAGEQFAGAPQDQYVGATQDQYAGAPQGQSYAAPGPQPQGASGGFDTPPPGTKGVYEGPLSGQPVPDSEQRTWGMLSQLAVVIGHVVSLGFLGWVGPLIIFVLYKDRSRFVRFQSAEALNGAIAVVIASIVLWIGLGIFAVLTLGIGTFLFPLAGIPALVQLIFAIIAAVKANQGEWWSYPLNIRLVR